MPLVVTGAAKLPSGEGEGEREGEGEGEGEGGGGVAKEGAVSVLAAAAVDVAGDPGLAKRSMGKISSRDGASALVDALTSETVWNRAVRVEARKRTDEERSAKEAADAAKWAAWEEARAKELEERR